MPALQTTYADNIRAAVAGMIANSEPTDIISRIVETAAGIGFGLVVAQGSADDGIIVPAGGTPVFRGITVRDVTRPPGDADKYPQYSVAAVMVRGVIWVTAGATVVAGEPAYFVAATGAITNVNTNIAIPNAIFDSSAASGALVKLRLWR